MGADMGPESGLKWSKPERRRKAKDRQIRVKTKQTKDVRQYVFGRERYRCRCCRLRPAESLHEIHFRSHGGKVSRRNSIAVCGKLVGTDQSCHTFLQQHAIQVFIGFDGAEGDLKFTPTTQQAADYMRVKVGETVESPIMQHIETAE